MLSMLDGENQVDHVVHIATTNYLLKLSPRIRNRPRRFYRVLEIGMPDEQMRYGYFTRKLLLSDADAKRWTRDTTGFSFAGLTEMVVSVICLGNDYGTMLEKIRELEDAEENLNE